MAKLMTLRREGVCVDCQQETAAGTRAFWFADERVVRCFGCVEHPAATQPSARAEQLVHAASSPNPAEHRSSESSQLDESTVDVAGESAQREYEKRSARERTKKKRRVAEDAAWRAEMKAQRPVAGRIVTALTAKPKITAESQATRAWKVGAEGERRVAEVLTGATGVSVLHDRKVPGSRANIDHLVVGPAGVFVIDAKKYTGQVEVRDVGGLLRTDERLYVKNRDRSSLVEAMGWQTEVVRTALGERFADVGIQPVLCFVGCEWGWFMRKKRVGEVSVLWPKALPELVSAAGPHVGRVEQIAEHLAGQLRQ